MPLIASQSLPAIASAAATLPPQTRETVDLGALQDALEQENEQLRREIKKEHDRCASIMLTAMPTLE